MRRLVLGALLILAAAAAAEAQNLNPPASGTAESSATGAGSGGLPTPPATDEPFQAQGDQLLKKLTARQFDSRLPAVPLMDWFAGLLGKRAQIDWSTAECGDEGGGSDSGSGQGDDSNGVPGANVDAPLCTEGHALFYGADGKPSLDRYVVLQLSVGTRRDGVNGDAASYGPDAVSVFVFDGQSTRTLSRLGDLPPVLSGLN